MEFQSFSPNFSLRNEHISNSLVMYRIASKYLYFQRKEMSAPVFVVVAVAFKRIRNKIHLN